MHQIKSIVSLSLLLCSFGFAANEDLSKKQCRSVHLSYDVAPAQAVYIEVVPEKTTPGTYFCAMGFHKGYLGIQELGNGEKRAIFSIWDDAVSQDAHVKEHQTPENERVKSIEHGENVEVSRFGNEGTGGKSMLKFAWEAGKPNAFLVKVGKTNNKTSYTGYVFDSKAQKWLLMATFCTAEPKQELYGLYSFIEDFKRDFQSATVARRASFKNAWSLNEKNEWNPMLKATFTADSTPSNNIDMGPVAQGFFLQTGGDTSKNSSQLGQAKNTVYEKVLPPALKVMAH